MEINSLRLRNFRSYDDESFEFDEGVNIIVGPNGSGKTNLLEALLVIATGKSYRARDAELISYDAPWGRLEASMAKTDRIVKFFADGNENSKKEFDIGGTKLSKLSWRHTLPVVLFEPSHLQLLSGGPEGRRNYLDGLLEQTVPGFGTVNRKYKRALSQRNALLKRPAAASQLFAWNIRLSELGGQIAETRQEIIKELGEITQLYSQLSRAKDTVKLEYRSTCNTNHYANDMLKKLEQAEKLDQERGFTSIGPHRDDLAILFNGRASTSVASRGEMRTIMLSIKSVEVGVIERMRGQAPILLLDDVFSELDGARRRALTDLMANYQTFITTTDADVVVQHFLNDCRIVAL